MEDMLTTEYDGCGRCLVGVLGVVTLLRVCVHSGVSAACGFML
jgi:hypothetical protein